MTERELKKDKVKLAWVALSEKLLGEFGVRLTDSATVHWGPRLVTTGGRRK